MQGWPGQGPGPTPGPVPGPGANGGRRIGIVAAVVAAVVLLSFGLALATGTDNRDGGQAMQPPPGGLPTDLGDLEGADLGASDGGTGGTIEGDTGGGDLGGGDLGGGDLGGSTTGSSGGTDIGGSTSSSGGGTTGYVDPTPPPDPTMDAYRSVQAGDCLRNWMTGETSWASDVPEVVGCGNEAAGVYVTQTTDDWSACPSDAGQSYLSYTSGLETVALCVSRQFAVGQCFLGTADGSANLMSWVDCEAGDLPSPYSQKYNVTGVYSAPSTITGGECARVQGDTTQYWYWTIDSGATLLCAVVY